MSDKARVCVQTAGSTANAVAFTYTVEPQPVAFPDVVLVYETVTGRKRRVSYNDAAIRKVLLYDATIVGSHGVELPDG